MPLSQRAKLLLRSAAAEATFRSNLLKLLERGNQHPWSILMYHRVVPPEAVPYPLQPGMYVTPESFRQQMELLKRYANVLPLDELVVRIRDNRPLPRRTVAVTFDDGWADNYTHAYPVLRSLELPATVFLATSFIDEAGWFWTDELSGAVSALRRNSEHLQAAANRVAASERLEEPYRGLLLSILTKTPEGNLATAVDRLIDDLKRAPLTTRAATVRKMLTLAREFCAMQHTRAFLTWPEVAEMARHNISFGSHTHSHQKLTELTPEQVSDELENSYQLLRSHRLTPSLVFCYPEGAYSAATQRCLADKRIEFALSTERRPVFDTSPMLFPRIGIHDDVSSTPALFAFRTWVEGPRTR